LPVSIYLDRSIGKTFSPNAAQCEQLIDAYSVMVTGAFGDPIAMSGSDTGFATAAAMALCATAEPEKDGAMAANRATMAMRWRAFNGLFQMADRGECNSNSSSELPIFFNKQRRKPDVSQQRHRFTVAARCRRPNPRAVLQH
jgi:hypothetical protein